MALTDRQYYQIFRTDRATETSLDEIKTSLGEVQESILFSNSIAESAGATTTYKVNASSLTGDKILIATPGSGKQIILLSVSSSNQDISLGTGSAGGSTFAYVADGGVSYPSGLLVAENSQVSTNATTGFLTITYTIVDV